MGSELEKIEKKEKPNQGIVQNRRTSKTRE